MTIKEIPLNHLVEYENNPRNNAGAVEAVANSIKEFGFKVPIVIDKDNIIIAGHTRKKAAELLGLETAPCIIADDLTPEQIKAFRLADNKTAELAEWDFEKLEAELAEIEFDMSAFGFDDFELEQDQTEVFEDEVPEIDEEAEPTTKLGDIWQLGKHRLMCGDSTDKGTIEKLMNGEYADLVFTDPPYGVNIVKSGNVSGGGATHFGKVGGDGKIGGGKIVPASNYRKIKGDDTTDTARLNYEIIKNISENQIIFGGNYFTDFLQPKSCWVVWDKENTGNFADVELAWTSFDKGAKLYKWLWNGLCRKGSKAIEGVSRVHPTQKPVGLIANILQDFSKENEIILDCFGGSGSTLIACEQTNRICYMVEYEPYYVEVIIKRWETLTGEKAVLL